MRMIHFLLEQSIDKNPFWRDDLRDHLEEVKWELTRSRSNTVWVWFKRQLLEMVHRNA